MSVFRVSEVESYRQWREDEDAELDDILPRLLGGFEPSAKMLAGTAFHAALEVAQAGDTDVLQANGYTFTISADIAIALTPIREVRASKSWVVDGQRITVSGQLDAATGKRIEDHKTTGRFDPERYLDGYQWRLYLDIFGADVFRWNVFEIKETPDPMEWDVFAFHSLEQHRYPALGNDCASLVADFARFVREYVPQRCLEAA